MRTIKCTEKKKSPPRIYSITVIHQIETGQKMNSQPIGKVEDLDLKDV